jgi:hypothetical protein
MRRRVGDDVPDLRGFMARQRSHVPRKLKSRPEIKTFFLETYGCQMNEADSEVVDSLLSSGGLERIDDAQSADVILMNTCAVREKAEDKIWGRLRALRAERIKKGNGGQLVGVLGCMAERLRNELLDEETLVNFIAGPDAYRCVCRRIPSPSPSPPLPLFLSLFPLLPLSLSPSPSPSLPLLLPLSLVHHFHESTDPATRPADTTFLHLVGQIAGTCLGSSTLLHLACRP